MNKQLIDISLEKEKIYIINNVDAIVIKNPMVIMYTKRYIHVWEDSEEKLIHSIFKKNITHTFTTS